MGMTPADAGALFVALAVLAALPSLSVLTVFLLALQLLAALWLLWLARALWRTAGTRVAAVDTGGPSLSAGFTAGLLLTLADHKAALFYLGFLPAFVDLATLGVAEVLLILLLTLLAVGGVKLAYALAAAHVGSLLQAAVATRLQRLAAGLLGAAAFLLLWRVCSGPSG